MNQRFKELGFRAGDKVLCLNSNGYHGYTTGKIYTLIDYDGDGEITLEDFGNGFSGDWHRVSDTLVTDEMVGEFL